MKADVDRRTREGAAWTRAKIFVSGVAFLFSIPDVADFYAAGVPRDLQNQRPPRGQPGE